ncbi:Uncharacterised protein [Mycobacterium tuberculosis]|uniref:Uncharacterized protein n=1 Tax=Mycobacterium tuberculosis TaxID=1773 RepID=A0A0U0UMB7_MYCTX|nr:Uncharacterised protein [Mycobacterium tuberculosis]CPA07153.1 Uncharacterised protein [Mycobacterium tuberculosis]CPB12224.1 Uncharacterised protein [Mycobacterium tuberculosis]
MGSVWLVSGTTPTWMVVPSGSTKSTPLGPNVVTRRSICAITSASDQPVLDSSRSHS